MKKGSKKFIKVGHKKAAIAVFCVAILLSMGIVPAKTLLNEYKTMTQKIGIKTRAESYTGNTGYESWYYYIGGIINSANGNLYLSESDLSIEARGFDIEIIRSYNSYNRNYSSGFGYGWTFNYNVYLIDKDDYVIWVDEDGSVHNFTSLGGGSYESPPGTYSRLNKNIDDTYTLWIKDGDKYYFDSEGVLQNIIDKNDNKLSLSYIGQKLIRITDDSGQYINISYNAENKIRSVEDPLGRIITYSYNIYGDLVEVTDAIGYSIKYIYSCCHRLASYIDKANVTITFSYLEDSNKVNDLRYTVYDETEQLHHNGYMLYFIVYDTTNRTTYYLNANNYASAIRMNDQGNPIKIIDSMNGTINIGWVDNQIVNMTDKNGNIHRSEFDEYGNIIKEIDPFGYERFYDWKTYDNSSSFISLVENVTKVAYEPTGSRIDIFNDTFDPANPIPGWVASSFWIQAPGPSHSPPESYGCGFGWYGQGWHETLQSPYFNLSGYTDVELSFWHMRDFDGDPTYPPTGYMPDGGNVKISTDGGQSWTLITPYGGYDGKLAYGQGNPMEVERAFGYSTYPMWVKERFNLTAYVGMASNVSIRFEMGTDINPSGHQGWFIDDVLISGYATNPRNITIQAVYDSNGNLKEINDYLGNSSYFSYDEFGNLLNFTDFREYKTELEYDTHGNLLNITDALGNMTKLKYDVVGRLTNSTDANGYTTSQVFDDNDNVIKIIDATGNTTQYFYNGNGALTSIIDENGHQTNYTISVTGRIEEEEDPTGNITIYKSSRMGETTSTTDAEGNTDEIGYDPIGRPISRTDSYGNTDWYGYDAEGNVVYVMNKNYALTHYEYDKLNRLIRVIDQYNGEIVYKYDEFGNLINVTDQNGHHTSYEYDELDRIIRITGDQESGSTESRFSYDENGNQIEFTDANSYVTRYEYDPLNRLIKITDPLDQYITYTYDAVGNIKSVTDKKGNTTTYDYDPLNRILKITDPLGNYTQFGYDVVGNLISIRDPRGHITKYFFDELNRFIQLKDATGNNTFYKYDAVDNLIQIIDANNNSIHFAYDKLNRLISETDQLGNSTNYTYDAVGNLIAVTDGNKNTVNFWYDALNRVEKSGNTIEGNYVNFTYDPKGNMKTVQDSNFETTFYSYDTLDRLISVTNPSGLKKTFEYDNVGNIINRTDENLYRTNYSYDALNRLIKIEYPVGNVTFDYDANDNLIYMSNNNIGLNDTTYISYDELNREIKVKVDYGLFNKIINYTYDETGNIKTVTNPEDGITNYEYDSLNRLIQITDPDSEITEFSYDKVGNLIKKEYPNGVYTNYTYDKIKCLINISTMKSDHSVLSSYIYDYDAAGNRVNMTDHHGHLTSYKYDHINRLKEVTYSTSGTNIKYTYDGVGNRLTKTINDTYTTTYSYTIGENRLTSDGTSTYIYDNNGNLINKITGLNTTVYTYDYENRLIQTTLPNATKISYYYSPSDNRISKIYGSDENYYLYDFFDVINEYDQNGAVQTSYIHGHILGPGFDEPIKITRGGNTGYHHTDGLGSITLITDENEAILNSYKYDDFGNVVSQSETIENSRKYTAKELDLESGLYFYRSRYYDANLGRFTIKDVFGMIDGINQYIYVGNNPINFVDPCGRKAHPGWRIGGYRTGPYNDEDNVGKAIEKAKEDYEEAVRKAEEDYKKAISKKKSRKSKHQENMKKWGLIKAVANALPLKGPLGLSVKIHIAAGDTLAEIPATEPLFSLKALGIFAKKLAGIAEDEAKGKIQGDILDSLGKTGKNAGKVLDIMDTVKNLIEVGKATQDLVDFYDKMKNDELTARDIKKAQRALALQKFKDDVLAARRLKLKITYLFPSAGSTSTSAPGNPKPPSNPAPNTLPPPQPSGGTPSPPEEDPPSGPTGSSQGGVQTTGHNPLEPVGQPTYPIAVTTPDPNWMVFLPTYGFYGGDSCGFAPGAGGSLGLPSPEEYCEYRMVYFGSKAIDDIGENQKALYNAIKWAANHPTYITTYILLMPSWGGYEGYDDCWEEFATEHSDIELLRWSDLPNERVTVTYSDLKMIDADVLIDSDHYSSTQQGGYYTTKEIEAIQKYLLDEHGYIATYGSLGDNPGQTNQTERLMILLGLKESEGHPNIYTNSNPWILDDPLHPIFFNISSGWNPGDVTGNLDIGLCPLCGEKHEGSKIAHLRSSSGDHHSLISAYALWYAPLSTGGLISQAGGECIVVPQTVYFGNRIVDDTGNNHDVLYNAIKWAAEQDDTEETNVLIMPGWGGYDGWSKWQTFNSSYSDINLLRWSDSSTSRDPVTIHGLEAAEADVLVDSNHSSTTQQGGFYTAGELQAIEWYVKTRGHGYIVTTGSIGNDVQQANQTAKLMELLSINNTATIDEYDNSENWIIDQQYHPIIYEINTWNPGKVTADLDIINADKIAHLYSTEGNHYSIISAYEGFGKGSCECECNIPPVANFTWSPSSPTTGDIIQFTDLSEDVDGALVNWTWDFDDDNTSYTQNPTHQYINDGTYNVNLAVRDDSGESAIISKPVVVTSGGPVENLDTGERFSTIQSAINDSDTLDGHTIFVGNGTYDENIVINKRIALIGEDKEITIIDGNELDDVITITVDDVNITEFTITQGGTFNGISITDVDNITINQTILTYSENGIYLESSNYITITDNNASHNNDDGVEIYHNSRYNTIQNNTFIDNGAGVFIYDATNNTINHNLIADSTAFGIQLYDAANNNTISNNTIVRTTNTTYGDICGDAICLFYYESTPITNCHIENNILDDNQRGITFRQTQYAIVRNNNIKNCSKIGLQIQQSSNNNLFYHNNFLNNTLNANDANSNTWDNDYPSGGNYWDDYTGVDLYHGPDQDILGADNIGDTPYDIPGGSNQDRYPLMYPWGAELEGFYLNLADFPMYEAESDPGYNEMCGPAVAQMTLNYIWWNSSNNSQPPMLFDNQTWLYERGRENNTNQSLPYLDTRGLWHIIQYNKPMPYSTFGYNFMKYSSEDLDEALKRIVLWINYTVGTFGGHKEGYPLHVPSVVPAYGDYTNWIAIRGFRSNRTAHPMPDEITVYGFWVNDPYPGSLGGIGENSYKALAYWVNDSYLPLTTDDIYNGKYVAILEPPEINENAVLTIAEPRPRFTPEQQDELKLTQLNKGLVPKDLIRQSNEWIIKAAIDGVTEELIPYDEDFAAAFAKTIAGTPIFVENNNGNDYYAVPFNLIVKKSRSLDLSKKVTSKENTIIVILIDAEDGSFKEVSWVKDPVKYLPISEKDAQKIVYQTLEEMGYDPEDIETITMKLVHRDSTLYYPEWKVTIDELGLEFFIKQDGTIS